MRSTSGAPGPGQVDGRRDDGETGFPGWASPGWAPDIHTAAPGCSGLGAAFTPQTFLELLIPESGEGTLLYTPPHPPFPLTILDPCSIPGLHALPGRDGLQTPRGLFLPGSP